MSTSPAPPPSTMASPVNVQTAPIRTAKKPKVITVKKPRREDLLKALRLSMEQGPHSRDTQRDAVRTVKKPVLRRSPESFSSTAEGPSEMADSDPDNGSVPSTGEAGFSHVHPNRVHGAGLKAVNKSFNRRSSSEPSSKTYCHQCRNRNLHPKMRCKGYRTVGRACRLSFCRNCINTRLVRRPDIANLVMADVLHFTVIRIFNSMKTRISYAQNVVDAATAARVQLPVERYTFPVDGGVEPTTVSRLSNLNTRPYPDHLPPTMLPPDTTAHCIT